jgi:HAD superfamily hydrolase (TIGR01549 family)
MKAEKRAVLFDYDDTLVQTRQCKYKAIIALAERFYGLSLAPSEIDKHWGIEYTALFRNLFAAVDADTARVIQRYEALNDEFPVLAYPDTLEAIDALLTQGTAVGIVTSAGNIVHAQMRSVGIPVARLELVQTASDTSYHKPDPRVFEPALQKLARSAIEKDVVTYVGDSLSDYRAASGAGLQFVGIHERTTARDAFEGVGARTVASLEELVQEHLRA